MLPTCVVAAPRPEYLRSLKRTIETDLEVVGMPDNPVSLAEAVRVLHPAWVVVDLALFGTRPWTSLSRLRTQLPEARLVALVLDEDLPAEERAREAGADLVLHRGRVASHLRSALGESLEDGRSRAAGADLPRAARPRD